MRHSFYCNNMRKQPSAKIHLMFSRDRPYKKVVVKGKKNKFSLSLEDRVNEVLTLYEEFPSIRTEILEKLEIYIINRTIARDLKSTKSEKMLTKEFSNYLEELKHQIRKV